MADSDRPVGAVWDKSAWGESAWGNNSWGDPGSNSGPDGPLTIRAGNPNEVPESRSTLPPISHRVEAEAGQLGLTGNVVELSVTTDQTKATVVPGRGRARISRLKSDSGNLLLMATSLGRMARAEIARLDSDSASRNDLDTIRANEKLRELLQIFAEGFEQLASALAALAQNQNQPLLLGTAEAVVSSVANELEAWWEKNKAQAVDWAIRIPVIAAGLGLLGLVGADMPIATAGVTAFVCPEVIGAIRGK